MSATDKPPEKPIPTTPDEIAAALHEMVDAWLKTTKELAVEGTHAVFRVGLPTDTDGVRLTLLVGAEYTREGES